MATIVITGISGFLGHRVHEQLRLSGHDVVGVDLAPPDDARGLAFVEADVRSRPDMDVAVAGADAVVHLATASHGNAPDHSVNVGGTQVVVDAAVAAGVATLVVMSSAMVYGARADNPVPLDEDAPLATGTHYPLVSQKVEVERLVAGMVDDPDAPRTVILRPAMVVGADAENLLTRALQGSRLLAVRGRQPPVQFVHVDDVASAITRAVTSDMSGAYNVACEGWMTTHELRAVLNRRLLEVPEEVARRVLDRSHALGLTRLAPSGLDWVMHPWVVDIDRLLATGWQPSIANHDAAALLAQERSDTVSIGAVEADRRTLQRVGLVAGTVGGVLALGALARSRRDGQSANRTDGR